MVDSWIVVDGTTVVDGFPNDTMAAQPQFPPNPNVHTCASENKINRLCSIASRTVANAGVCRIVVHRIHWSKVRLLLLPWIVRVLIHLLLRWRAIIGWNLNWALYINLNWALYIN